MKGLTILWQLPFLTKLLQSRTSLLPDTSQGLFQKCFVKRLSPSLKKLTNATAERTLMHKFFPGDFPIFSRYLYCWAPVNGCFKCANLRASLTFVHCVHHVPTCFTHSRALPFYVLSCLCFLRVFLFFTCLGYLHFLSFLRVFILYVPCVSLLF